MNAVAIGDVIVQFCLRARVDSAIAIWILRSARHRSEWSEYLITALEGVALIDRALTSLY